MSNYNSLFGFKLLQIDFFFSWLAEIEMFVDILNSWIWYLQMASLNIIYAFRCALKFVVWLNQLKQWKLVLNNLKWIH